MANGKDVNGQQKNRKLSQSELSALARGLWVLVIIVILVVIFIISIFNFILFEIASAIGVPEDLMGWVVAFGFAVSIIFLFILARKVIKWLQKEVGGYKEAQDFWGTIIYIIISLFVGILMVILREVVGRIGLPAAFTHVCGWLVLWLIVTMVVSLFITNRIEKRFGIRTQNGGVGSLEVKTISPEMLEKKSKMAQRLKIAGFVFLFVGISTAILYEFAKVIGLPEALLNIWYWLGLWLVVSIIIQMFVVREIEQRRGIRTLTKGDGYLEAQTKGKQILVEQLGFQYQPPEDSDNLHSTGYLRGIYEQRTFNIEFGFFTQIETELSNAEGLSLEFWMNEHRLGLYLRDEENVDLEFDYTDGNVELVRRIMETYVFKERFVGLGAFHIDANQGNLLIKFKEGSPDISQMRSYLDLTKEVAEKIEAFSVEQQKED